MHERNQTTTIITASNHHRTPKHTHTLSKPAFLFAIALSNKHCIATIPAQYPVPRYPTVPKSAHANVACANPLAASSNVSYDPGTHRATIDAIVSSSSSFVVRSSSSQEVSTRMHAMRATRPRRGACLRSDHPPTHPFFFGRFTTHRLVGIHRNDDLTISGDG